MPRSQYWSSIAPCDRARRSVFFFFLLLRPLWMVTPRTQCVPIIVLYIIVICFHQEKKKPYEFNGRTRYFSPGDDLTTVTPLQRSPTRHMIWSFFFLEEDYYLFFFSFFPFLYICLRVPAPMVMHVVFSATRAPGEEIFAPHKETEIIYNTTYRIKGK